MTTADNHKLCTLNKWVIKVNEVLFIWFNVALSCYLLNVLTLSKETLTHRLQTYSEIRAYIFQILAAAIFFNTVSCSSVNKFKHCNLGHQGHVSSVVFSPVNP